MIHLIPVMEDTHTQSLDCWCRPKIILHNAWYIVHSYSPTRDYFSLIIVINSIYETPAR